MYLPVLGFEPTSSGFLECVTRWDTVVDKQFFLFYRWCEQMCIPFTYEMLKVFAKEILTAGGADSHQVSHDWCQDFRRRHNFSTRKPKHVERSRLVACSTPENIGYFNILTEEVTEMELTDKPEESGIWTKRDGPNNSHCSSQSLFRLANHSTTGTFYIL